LLDGGVSTEGSEEVGEEGALGWHCGVIHEEDARRLDVEGKKGRVLWRKRNKELAEGSDCGVDTPSGRGVYSVWPVLQDRGRTLKGIRDSMAR